MMIVNLKYTCPNYLQVWRGPCRKFMWLVMIYVVKLIDTNVHIHDCQYTSFHPIPTMCEQIQAEELLSVVEWDTEHVNIFKLNLCTLLLSVVCSLIVRFFLHLMQTLVWTVSVIVSSLLLALFFLMGPTRPSFRLRPLLLLKTQRIVKFFILHLVLASHGPNCHNFVRVFEMKKSMAT